MNVYKKFLQNEQLVKKYQSRVLEYKIKENNIIEHNLPTIERIAYCWPVLKFVFASILNLCISVPLIYFNYEKWWVYLTLSPLIICFIFGTTNFVIFLHHHFAYRNWDEEQGDSSNHTEIYSGPPGSGKTLSACYAIEAMSRNSWKKLQLEYWFIMSKLTDPNYKCTEEEREVVEAYQFYQCSEGAPCLASNIPIYSKRFKKYSYECDIDHLKQEKRMPYRSNALMDEIGAALSVELFQDRKKNVSGAADVSDMFRYSRHFGEIRIIGCEQDPNNVFIDVRRVVADNRVYTGKKIVLKPKMLSFIYDLFVRHFVKRMSVKESKRFAVFMKKFNRFINNCGFFRFEYSHLKNTETNKATVVIIDKVDKGDVIYLPKAMPFFYVTRAFASAYKCVNKDVDMKPYKKSKLSPEKASKMLKSSNLVKG